MPLFSKTIPFKGQRYSELKRNCERKNVLFVDREFPPAGSSIYHSRPAPADIVWKRPKDIVSDPKFFIDKASADDFAQGEIGNCWFVAACACIAEDTRLWKKIVPDHKSQEWSPHNKYSGIFHFKFWRCGVWHHVVIDDFLPTRMGRLIFLRSKTRNEFWSALLEKAYAKLFGSYEALRGGKARDAMVDMTGGVGESLEISNFRSPDERTRLFNILYRAMNEKSLMTSSIMARSAAEMETKLSVGLVRGHSYSVTDVKKITLKGTHSNLFNFFNKDKIFMIRLRNPWGGMEWKGAWSDGSIEWKQVSEKQKKDLGLTFDDNGEFWMSFDDYCRYFTNIDICHIINTSLLSLKKTWREIDIINQWRRPHRAGGCGNNKTFLDNPQYLFKVFEDEEEVLISMEQEDRRCWNEENHVIGVTILKADLNRKYRMHDRLNRIHAGPFVQSRSVLARIALPKGNYCFIPSTFQPGQEGRFLMRFFSAGDITYKELKLDEPKPPGCFGEAVHCATAVTIVNAEQVVVKSGEPKDVELYCMIMCEKKEIRTPACKLATNPDWNHRATFYRTRPDQDIEIQVWETSMLRDSLVGTVTLPMAKAREYTGGNTITRYDLIKKGDDDKTERTGFLWLKVFHTTNLMLV